MYSTARGSRAADRFGAASKIEHDQPTPRLEYQRQSIATAGSSKERELVLPLNSYSPGSDFGGAAVRLLGPRRLAASLADSAIVEAGRANPCRDALAERRARARRPRFGRTSPVLAGS
jgi:hypothetical protein